MNLFRTTGTVLSWIKSYLSNRKQKIKIGDSFSEAVILPFGVPQGSVLGPLLFTLYISLDYCNSLLYGVSKSNIDKLQRVQNALCRIIFRLDKMSHVTPFLKKLHWLPIQHRILFKYNLLVFKAINLSQPPYLSALIRSSSLTRGNRLSISSTRPKKHIGRRGFAVAAPAEWNKLPQTVRSQQTIDGFRSQLKTYLFRLAYPPP